MKMHKKDEKQTNPSEGSFWVIDTMKVDLHGAFPIAFK